VADVARSEAFYADVVGETARDLLALARAERGDRPEKGTIGLAFLYPTRG
jgi:hypothetical protein